MKTTLNAALAAVFAGQAVRQAAQADKGRVGAQTDDPARHCVKRIPSAAIRSRFGVRTEGCP